MIKLLYNIILLVVLLTACSETDDSKKNYLIKPDGTKVYKTEGVELTLLEKDELGNVKNFEDMSFVFKSVSSLDYLERSGEKVDDSDRKSLENESVFMIEFVGHKLSGSIFDQGENSLSEQDATKYLIGEIENDFVVIQNKKRIKPLGVQYDGKIGNSQKIRVTFLMEGVNLKKDHTIEYNDRLFGKGKVRLKQENNLTS